MPRDAFLTNTQAVCYVNVLGYIHHIPYSRQETGHSECRSPQTLVPPAAGRLGPASFTSWLHCKFPKWATSMRHVSLYPFFPQIPCAHLPGLALASFSQMSRRRVRGFHFGFQQFRSLPKSWLLRPRGVCKQSQTFVSVAGVSRAGGSIVADRCACERAP